jgi:signal transduction histidine kinase
MEPPQKTPPAPPEPGTGLSQICPATRVGSSSQASELFSAAACPVLALSRGAEVLFANQAAHLFLSPSVVEGSSLHHKERHLVLQGHPSFKGAVLGHITRTRYWNCVELSVPPEALSKRKPLAVVFELGQTKDSPLIMFITVCPDSANLTAARDVEHPATGENEMSPSGADEAPLSSLQEREEFLATAAHDLKNPLSAIFGYADALLETSGASQLSDQQKSILGKIRATSARSIDLLRNYQQLSDLSVHRLGLTDIAPDLGATCKTVMEECFREDPTAHTVRAVLSQERLPVAVDRIPLERILTNLFANALRYTPRGGTITLSTSRTGNLARFEINNSSPAIPKEEFPKLFSKRFRGSTSKNTSGTGLGLYIVRTMVKDLGGSIVVRSSEGEGTTFTLDLPLATGTS